jgi:hypothetical protein
MCQFPTRQLLLALFLRHTLDHKSINSHLFEEFETDPRPRKYLKTFCQLKLFATSLLKNSFAMILHHHGIRNLHMDHILDHKSINSGPIEEFETVPRPRKYLKTFCQLRLFATPLLQDLFAMILHHCGIRIIFQDHILNHKSINSGPIKEFETDPRLENYLKTSANSDCSQRHCCKIRL